MNSLKHRTTWRDAREDGEGNNLVVRIEQTQTLGASETPTTVCKLRIASPGEDEFGRTCKKILEINAYALIVSRLRDAITTIDRTAFNFRPSEATVQLVYDVAEFSLTQALEVVTDKLVVMCEVPPFATPSEIQPRYVIGNGEDVRFTIGSLGDFDTFCRRLEDAVYRPTR